MTIFIKKVVYFSFLVCLFMCGYVGASIPYNDIYNLPNEIFATYDEVAQANQNKLFGEFITLEIDDVSPVSSTEADVRDVTLNIKLLNLITIKEIDINILNNTELIVGGNALGFSLKCSGVIIVAFNDVITNKGSVNPFEESNLKIGDRIVTINNQPIMTMEDIDSILTNPDYNGEPLNICAFRNGLEIKNTVTPVKEYISNRFKLGIWVREDATGVGTLTYIRTDNGRFGALGHGIYEGESSDYMQICDGEIYQCDVIGVNKGERGKTGELRGLFVAGKNAQGKIDLNNKYGVFGVINEDSILNNNKTYKIGGRLTAKPGKAKILCSINGSVVKEYDIEIIKTNYQKNSNDRSMVIKVTDKELLEKTGGIVQGMSGSPIIQDGKILGAVTHVFVNDPTKGFGIYIDWMVNN